MRWQLVLAGCLLTTTLGAAIGQEEKDDVQSARIRDQIEQLENQLRIMENANLGTRRVTTIGGMRTTTRGRGMEIRIYDLSDLFAIAPPYLADNRSDLTTAGVPELIFPNIHTQATAQGGFGGGFGGGGHFSVPDQRATLNPPPPRNQVLHQLGEGSSAGQSSMDDLVSAIKVTISPEVWTTDGGGSIAKLGNALIISADADTHDQIDAMLNLFRKRWGSVRTVSIEAYWLWLTEAELAPALVETPAKPNPGNPGDDLKTYGLIKPDAWKKILEDRQKPEGDYKPGWRAKITCYNGQTVHTVSGTQRLSVVQVRPMVLRNKDDGKPEGTVAYRPEVNLIQEVAALQVTPIAGVSGETVLLDIHSRVCLPEEAKAVELKEVVKQIGVQGDPAQLVEVIDKSRLLVQRFSTTLRVPVGEPMLVGGMTFSVQPKPGEPTLYLFVKTSVQELGAEEVKPIQADVEAKPPAEAGKPEEGGTLGGPDEK